MAMALLAGVAAVPLTILLRDEPEPTWQEQLVARSQEEAQRQTRASIAKVIQHAEAFEPVKPKVLCRRIWIDDPALGYTQVRCRFVDPSFHSDDPDNVILDSVL